MNGEIGIGTNGATLVGSYSRPGRQIGTGGHVIVSGELGGYLPHIWAPTGAWKTPVEDREEHSTTYHRTRFT